MPKFTEGLAPFCIIRKFGMRKWELCLNLLKGSHLLASLDIIRKSGMGTWELSLGKVGTFPGESGKEPTSTHGDILTSKAKSLFYEKTLLCAAFFQRGYKYIWFSLFFLSRGSQKAPDHVRTRKSRFLIGKATISEMHVLVFSVLIEQSGKISENRPAMAREDTQR